MKGRREKGIKFKGVGGSTYRMKGRSEKGIYE